MSAFPKVATLKDISNMTSLTMSAKKMITERNRTVTFFYRGLERLESGTLVRNYYYYSC